MNPRPVLPTDFLPLATFDVRCRQSAAWPRERVGTSVTTALLGTVRDQALAVARRRSVWVSVRRQRLRGLLGARQRSRRQAWEVDYLVDQTSGGDALRALHDRALADLAARGVEKLFLRLAAESDLLDTALAAGFVAYRQEVLFSGELTAAGSPPLAARRTSQTDAYPLFRLYCAATPETVRRHEAATFGEWQAGQERIWLKGGCDLVSEREGRIDARVRAARLPQGIAVDVVGADDGLDATMPLLAAAVSERGGGRVSLLVPETETALAARLAAGGLVAGERYVCLCQRTTRPIAMPSRAPAVAKPVLGA